MEEAGAGLLRGYTGDYLVAFLAAGLACLLAAWLVMRVGRMDPASQPS